MLLIHICTIVITFLGARHFIVGGAPFGDDHSAHFTLAMHIATLIREGTSDFYWNQMNMGLPLFASYQPLPSLFTGLILSLTNGLVAPLTLFKCIIVGVWATMPATWYIGLRLMDASRTKAVIIGLLILLIRQTEHVGLGITSSAYEGLYTQSWGLWLLPLGIGAFYQTLIKRNIATHWAAILFSLTLMSHLFTGLLMMFACGFLTLTHLDRPKSQTRMIVQIGLWSSTLTAFWILPLLLNRDYLGGLPWMTETYDGWALQKTIQHILDGSALDQGRWPWLTALCVAGCLWSLRGIKTDKKVQATLAFALITLALMGGREVWGPKYAAIPLHEHVNPVRYITALHIVGIISAATLIEVVLAKLKTRIKFLPMFLGLAYLAWAAHHFSHTQSILKTKSITDTSMFRIAGELQSRAGQRFVVGGKYGTGSHFHRDFLPYLAERAQLQSYSLGYHATFGTYYARYMEMTRSSLRLFNVTTLLTRNNEPAPEVFKFHRGINNYKIYQVPRSESWGYFDLAHVTHVVEGNLRDLRPTVRKLAPTLFENRQLLIFNPQLDIDVLNTNELRLPRGSILHSKAYHTRFEAEVLAEEDLWLLLKVNYFPYWHAELGQTKVPIHHVGPNFMAIRIPQGQHQVTFSYQNPSPQKFAALCSLLLFLGLPALSWIQNLRKRQHR